MDEFTDEVALAAGGWDRRFARVLATATVGTSAVAIIDANGAAGGRTYENTETYVWDDAAGWTCMLSSGGYGAGANAGLVFIGGDAAPGERVVVGFEGREHPIIVGATGYWLFAAANEGRDELPIRSS